MDARDFWGSFHLPYEVDTARMKLIWDNEDEDEDGPLEVTFRYEVCSLCEGKGSHVNPAIDAHGITESERAEWSPDEWEGYRSGVYNIPCNRCKGLRVVPVIDEDRNPPELVVKWNKRLDAIYDEIRLAYRERLMGY